MLSLLECMLPNTQRRLRLQVTTREAVQEVYPSLIARIIYSATGSVHVITAHDGTAAAFTGPGRRNNDAKRNSVCIPAPVPTAYRPPNGFAGNCWRYAHNAAISS
jgi:hypothetical protein